MSATITITYHSTNHEMNEILDGQLVTSGRALFSIIVLELKDGRAAEISTLLDRYVRLRRGRGDWTNQPSTGHIYDQEYYFELIDPAGNTIFSSQKPSLLSSSSQSMGFFKVEENGSEWHIFGLKDTNTQYTFFTGQSIDLRRQLSRESTLYMLLPFVVGTPLILITIWIGIGVGLNPIDRLSRELDNRKPDDLNSLETSENVTELNPLIQAMNRLFYRVSTMLENERRFSADAAHELRTPLAGLKANIDAAQFYTEESKLKAVHKNIESGIDNAINITEGLLLLSKLDGGHSEYYFEKEIIDIYRIVKQEIDQLGPDQRDRVTLFTQCVEYVALVTGSNSLVRMLVRNIIDNALRYSDDKQEIAVDLLVDESVTLSVADSGPGIPISKQEQVFQRFYRLDTNTANGSGLGLSLSQQISESMGGGITLKNREPTGLLVTIQLPLYRATETRIKSRQTTLDKSNTPHNRQPD